MRYPCVYIFHSPQDHCVGDCCWDSPSSSSDGNRIPGVAWPMKNVDSVENCAQKCTEIRECNGFHYYGQTDGSYGDCYLKQEVTSIATNLADNRGRYGGICSREGV